MQEFEGKEKRGEIFSKAVRAGKRTYFFDVKATKSQDYYLTITESIRRFNDEQGKFFYEKHKVYLYKEDFEKFEQGLRSVIGLIETGKFPEPGITEKDEGISSGKQDTFKDLSKDEEVGR